MYKQSYAPVNVQCESSHMYLPLHNLIITKTAYVTHILHNNYSELYNKTLMVIRLHVSILSKSYLHKEQSK